MTQKIGLIAIVFLSFLMPATARSNMIDGNRWDWLIGDWIGEGAGQPGRGGGTFSFQFDLDRNILVRRSHSEYPATNTRPATVHDDLMIVYPGEDGSPERAIYFDNENHVIRYTVEHANPSVIFLSEKRPNTPLFRLTYTSLEEGLVHVRFEISQDGERFITYIQGKSQRIE